MAHSWRVTPFSNLVYARPGQIAGGERQTPQQRRSVGEATLLDLTHLRRI